MRIPNFFCVALSVNPKPMRAQGDFSLEEFSPSSEGHKLSDEAFLVYCMSAGAVLETRYDGGILLSETAEVIYGVEVAGISDGKLLAYRRSISRVAAA